MPPQDGYLGFYTDRPSYAPDETVRVFGNWSDGSPVEIQYQLRRVKGWSTDTNVPVENTEGGWDTVWTSPTTITYSEAQTPPFGCFVDEFETDGGQALDLSGSAALTIEGWVRPTTLTGDEVVVAGQASCSSGAGPTCSPIGAYLGLRADGHARAVVTPAGGAGTLDVASAVPLTEDEWHYLALVYDGTTLCLYVATCEDNETTEFSTIASIFGPTTCTGVRNSPGVVNPAAETCSVSLSSPQPIAALTSRFRVGARDEAPGLGESGNHDLTGCFSGRLDRLGVWSRALDVDELHTLMDQGGTDRFQSGMTMDQTTDPDCLLFLDFEDDYQEFVRGAFRRATLDSSGNGYHGLVVRHGTPGVAGRPLATGRALRLTHDRIMDAVFDEHVVTIDLATVLASQPKKSGMYVLQAIEVEPPAAPDPYSEVNRRANRFTSFVVKPGAEDPPSADKVAAIVPVNTWLAYNPWPGADESRRVVTPTLTELITAPGITVRDGDAIDPATGQMVQMARAQGQLGSYRSSGGGGGIANYMGWNRPNRRASPRIDYDESTQAMQFTPETRSENAAHLDAALLGWLSDTTGDGTHAYDVDVYTDIDLHENPCLLDGYGAVVLVAHSEFWSLDGLVGLHRYLEGEFARSQQQNEGNLLSVGGNSIIWRSEIATVATEGYEDTTDPQNPVPVAVDNYVLEVKKWPEVEMLGPWDGLSLVSPADPTNPHDPDGRTGAWRLVEMLNPPPGASIQGLGGYRDYVLGTVPDMTGVAGGPVCLKGWSRTKQGYWRLTEAGSTSSHWLLSGLVDNTLQIPGSTDPADPRLLVQAGRVVGNEADRYVCQYEIFVFFLQIQCAITAYHILFPGVAPIREWCPPVDVTGTAALNAPPLNLPVTFPFSDNGQVEVLAHGREFEDNCYYNTIVWCSPILDSTDPDVIDKAASFEGTSGGVGELCYVYTIHGGLPTDTPLAGTDIHGNIVYYRHRGQGRVLTISAIDAAFGLLALPTGMTQDGSQIRVMARRALDCMLGACTDPNADAHTVVPLAGPLLCPQVGWTAFPWQDVDYPVADYSGLCGGL